MHLGGVRWGAERTAAAALEVGQRGAATHRLVLAAMGEEVARHGAANHRLDKVEVVREGSAAAPLKVARRDAVTHCLLFAAAEEEGTTATPL